ncbi:MAG: 50S ribosomal protein L11 methyltransferase [Gemmatimonadaceae bacterium]
MSSPERGGGEWTVVRVVPGSNPDAVAAALFAAGAQGLQETSGVLVTHAPSLADAAAFERAVLAASADARVETSSLPNVDWSEEWKRSLHVQRLGALTVAPPWLADGLDPQRTIVIDPGMAFGTGEHATTRGVIRLLQLLPRVPAPGDHVADLGAGSAVLAIAAAKLGASHVAAIEIDPDAIGNAEENVARNGVGDRVKVIEGDAATLLPLVAPVRIITANIISSVLLDLLPLLARALDDGGHAILSGILGDEREMMVRALAGGGWVIVAEDSEENWWSATIARL